MGSWSRILLSILVVVLGLALTTMHAHKLACLAGMIYCGYGIIMDFSALSSTMWWSLSKITWFCVGYIALWGLTLIMGFLHVLQ